LVEALIRMSAGHPTDITRKVWEERVALSIYLIRGAKL